MLREDHVEKGLLKKGCARKGCVEKGMCSKVNVVRKRYVEKEVY